MEVKGNQNTLKDIFVKKKIKSFMFGMTWG